MQHMNITAYQISVPGSGPVIVGSNPTSPAKSGIVMRYSYEVMCRFFHMLRV